MDDGSDIDEEEVDMDAATAYKQRVQRDKTRHATRLNAESAKQFDPALSSILYGYVGELLSSDRFKRLPSSYKFHTCLYALMHYQEAIEGSESGELPSSDPPFLVRRRRRLNSTDGDGDGYSDDGVEGGDGDADEEGDEEGAAARDDEGFDGDDDMEVDPSPSDPPRSKKKNRQKKKRARWEQYHALFEVALHLPSKVCCGDDAEADADTRSSTGLAL